MSEFIPTIGLEIHAQLKTATKMFCRSRNDPDERRPNVNVCPVCLAHPGALPTINKQAVEQVLRVGLALGGRLADYTEFDRKNYFYPDIPKGYQISQYQYPLISGGELLGVKLTRIHLEEDTARNQHSESGAGESLVDFNRAGVPLMELVTEPVITSARQAGDFAREWQLLLRYLGVSEANLEKGEMRVEANISIAAAGERGTKVEVKNLNSFRSVERAIEFELKRQKEILEKGEAVVQETRGWDEQKGRTFSQRKKESAHDYRYFPEPDLPKLRLSAIPEFRAENLQKTLPELPGRKRERYQAYGIQAQDVELYIGDPTLGRFFENLIKEDDSLAKIASNFLANDVLGLMKKNPELKLPEVSLLIEIIKRFRDQAITSRQAKDQIKLLVEEGRVAEAGVRVNLEEIIAQVVVENPKVVADYKSGKESALQFLIGQSMKQSKGAANPETLKKLFVHRLSTVD